MNFYMSAVNYRCLNDEQKITEILKRNTLRNEFYERLIKFCFVCIHYKIRMIFENPWAEQTYLKANFIKTPDVVDMNRSERGDYMRKPTAFWFWNCEPTHGNTYQPYKGELKKIMTMKGSGQAGLCSEERSMISPDYARNWICDFVIGKVQNIGQLSFDFS